MIDSRNFHEQLRPVLFYSVLVMTGGILFSMALSSIAFAISVLVFLAMLMAAHRAGRLALIVQRSGLEWYILAWIAAVVLMVAFAQYPQSALGSAKRVLLISLVFLIPSAMRDAADLRRFLFLLAVIGGLHSLASIVIFFLGDAARLGVFQHYMTGGGIRMLLLLLFLPLALDRRNSRRDRTVIGVAVLCMLLALVLTQTRSSWVGFAAGAVFLGVLRYRSILLGLAVLAIVFWFTAPAHYQDRISHMFTTDSRAVEGSSGDTEAVVGSNKSRLRMIETGWRMFLDHPVIGVGDGEMHSMYREYVSDAIKDEGGHLHNTYIHILATHGAIGALALLGLFFGLARLYFRTYILHRANATGILASGAMAAFLGFLINGLAEYNFGDHEIALILWMVTGIVVAAAAKPDESTVIEATIAK